MHANDVKLSRLTSNLLTLAEEVAAYSVAETKRSAEAVANAREAALLSVKQNPEHKKRGRAAVVSWDLGHNPVGRAYVLYQLLEQEWDVDLVGPMWSRFGEDIWEPLRDCDLQIRSFHCTNISEFVPKAEALAATKHYDIVYVCKPRLPSLYLGAIIKQASNCPLMLDIDDFELSFFKNDNYASIKNLTDDIHVALHEPHEELATRYAQTLASSADAVTVSNIALRSRFGGHLLRHARDESVFENCAERRASARTKLGISNTDFALMFIGTPRSHKGVLDVANALNELNDPDMVFHIIGSTTDDTMKESLEKYTQARIVLHPNCAFNELPDILAGADVVPLMQDVEHAICQYQIPAKVSDALALGVPVVATRTPPLADLIASGAILEADRQSLPQILRDLKQRLATGRDEVQSDRGQARRSFLSEFSATVNKSRLTLAIDEAVMSHIDHADAAQGAVSIFSKSGHSNTAAKLPPALAQMVDMMRKHYRGLRGEVLRSAKERRGEEFTKKPKPTFYDHLSQMPSIIRSRTQTYDVAFFWKQNDSNLYGRRADMITKEFARSGRVRKILHLDAPVSAPSMDEHFERTVGGKNEQQDMIVRNLIDRQMGIFDTDVIRARTHVFSNQSNKANLLGEAVSPPGAYIRFVNEQLEEHGMRARNTIAWFCPIIWGAPELIKNIGFSGHIADLIDDQRAWKGTADSLCKQEKNYRETLSAADLIFANCDSLAEAMQSYTTSRIHVVPNGAERFDRFPSAPIPESLKGIRGPIAGYVGNLRDRIDWTLLHEIVVAMPDVSFVFFGPSDNNPNADSLAKHKNVHILGVVPYEELAFHLKAFDVGLVPHLNNQLTERMNPLKVYNYFAAGLPIVSSEVANLESLGSVLKKASNATEFILAIRESLANPVDTKGEKWQATMDVIAWENRVGNILETMDQSLHRKLRKSA